MHKIFLINMPFSSLTLPSIGLTQLRSVVDSTFKDQISTEILYFNQEFVRFLGSIKHVHWILDGPRSHVSGIGDWFFSRSAFPEEPDNSDAYFKRYYPHRDEQTKGLISLLEEKRKGLDDFLDSLIEQYGMSDAFIVGLTSMFSQTGACLAMAKRLKRVNPNIIIAMGGANCEAPMGKELVKNVDQVDYVFSGPALKSFPELITHCLSGDFDKCHSIHGVFTKQNCKPSLPLVNIGGGCGTAIRDIGDELDINTPLDLDYSSFIQNYSNNFPKAMDKIALTFETSRGCWWGQRAHCTFCGLNGGSMAYRAMKPEMALETFSQLFKYSPDVSIFQCVDSILAKNYLTDVLPYLETPPNASIFYEVKADLKEEEVQVLAKARVNEIQPGIEALATSTLKLMRKGTTAFHNISLLKLCLTYEIQPLWNLLVGFPGERKEVFEKYVRDLPNLTHLSPPAGCFPVRFDRYSPYFTKAKEYGLMLEPMDFYYYVYPFSKESIENLAYYFTDTNRSAEYFTTMVRWLGKMQEKVSAWKTRWSTRGQNGNGAHPVQSKPQLYFKNGGAETVIYDSRFGDPVEHRLSDRALQLLKHAAKPLVTGTAPKEMGELTNADIEKAEAELEGKGLIFRDDNRYMSLVMSGPTKQIPQGHG